MSSPRVVVIVQARMSSTRLPGKVLMPLGGMPVLAWIMDRLARVEQAAECLVATSDDPSDDVIADFCADRSIRVVRGPLLDVLGRYHHAADEAGAEAVVRITADCPLVDPEVVDMCILAYLDGRGEVDYASNVVERTFPVGLDVEVFSHAALETAFRTATAPADREHVTPFIIRTARLASVTQVVDLSLLRWTLDYPDDYDAIDRIIDRLSSDPAAAHGKDRFGRAEIYQLLLRDPSLIHTAPHARETQETASLLPRIAAQVAELRLAR